jgi:serine/threonine protein kinase
MLNVIGVIVMTIHTYTCTDPSDQPCPLPLGDAVTITSARTSPGTSHGVVTCPQEDLFPIHNSMDPVDELPSHRILAELGTGMSGKVWWVEMGNGQKAALKCSWRKGHPLLRGYGHLLDTMVSKYFPKPFGYYKRNGTGDCVFMEVTGPTLAQMRKATGTITWLPETIASMGIQLLHGLYRMHTEFEIAHRDLNPSNLAVALETPVGSLLPTKAMLIDLDFGMSIHARELRYQDLRQLLVSLRFLFDEDGLYWAINPTLGVCSSDQKRYDYCIPEEEDGAVREATETAPTKHVLDPLCRAIVYACTYQPAPGNDNIDYKRVENLLMEMLSASGHEYTDEIIWTDDIAHLILQNLHTPMFNPPGGGPVSQSRGT